MTSTKQRFLWYVIHLKGGDINVCGACANRYKAYERTRHEDVDWPDEQPQCERCWKRLPGHHLS